jgi:hypothetical protein
MAETCSADSIRLTCTLVTAGVRLSCLFGSLTGRVILVWRPSTMRILLIACSVLCLASVTPPAFGQHAAFSPVQRGGSYCDGHRDGHRAGADAFGMGYWGYPGCPGDPGSTGGNQTPYSRGYSAGVRQATREGCQMNPSHQICKEQ